MTGIEKGVEILTMRSDGGPRFTDASDTEDVESATIPGEGQQVLDVGDVVDHDVILGQVQNAFPGSTFIDEE